MYKTLNNLFVKPKITFFTTYFKKAKNIQSIKAKYQQWNFKTSVNNKHTLVP